MLISAALARFVKRLADAATSAAGAGLVGFNAATGYAAGTVGRWLADLALAVGSTLIGWAQAGVGAVLRTISDKLRERVSVRDFGAKGDGVTDDTAAVQKAIDAVFAAGGGVVVVPPSAGAYMLNPRAVQPVSPAFHLVALQMRNGVTIKAHGATLAQFKNTDTHGGFASFEGCSDAHVSGGTWLGDKALHALPLPAGEFCFGFFINAAKRCSVKGASIKNSRGDGVYIGGIQAEAFDAARVSYDIEVSGNVITNAGRNGISVVGAQRYVIEGNVITGTWGYAPEAGIDIEPDHTYAGNWGAVDGTVTGNVITENAGDGLTIFRSNGLAVHGNTIARNGQRGISMRGDVFNTTISGNTVKIAGTAAASDADTYAGLYMDSVAGSYSEVLISGNTFDAAKAFNVSIVPGGRVAMSGNAFSTSADAAALWGATGPAGKTSHANSYFSNYLNAGDAEGLRVRGCSYRMGATGATWRGEGTFLVSIGLAAVKDCEFSSTRPGDGLAIRLDGGGAALNQFHRNEVSDSLSVGPAAAGFWAASDVDFSRSLINGGRASLIFVRTNSPALGWLLPNVTGNAFEYAFGYLNEGNGVTYRQRIWNGAAWKNVAAYA